MDAMYRVLGIAARLNERGSRFRVNFVPSNLVVLFLLGAGVLGTGRAALEGWKNGSAPRHARISDVLAHQNLEHNYVTVAGHLVPKARITATRGKSGEVTRTWVPLLDANGRKGLLVQVSNGLPEDKPSVVEITGMLRPMDSDLRRELQASVNGSDTPRLDLDYVLEQGDRPGDPLLFGVAALVLGAVFLAGIVTWAMRYVVFRRTPEVELDSPHPSEAANPDLRVTGAFSLDGQPHRQRFLDVPAATGLLETGERVFVTNVDASSRLYGMTTQERKGYWLLGIRDGSLQRPEPGLLYLGMRVRPALRVRYEDLETGASSQAVLSFASAEERAALYRDLVST